MNDEINKLMREKRHWENQIVALGGANYRRNVAMLDDDGKEVPGTKGYKYVVMIILPPLVPNHCRIADTLDEQRTSLVYENYSKVARPRRTKRTEPCHTTKSS